MDTLLVVVTVISLALATGLAVVAWKLLRDGRARSSARVQMLSSLADIEERPRGSALAFENMSDADVADDDADDADDADDDAGYVKAVADEAGYDVFEAAPLPSRDDVDVVRPVAAPRVTPVARPQRAAAARPAVVKPVAARFASIDDDDIDAPMDHEVLAHADWMPARPVTPSPADLLFKHIPAVEEEAEDPQPMFAATSFERTPTNGLIGMAAVAAIVVLGAATVFAFKPASHMIASLTRDSNAAAPAASPLELLSLRNADDHGDFTVTGLVQNPNGAPVLKDVVAVVYLFDQDGRYFASGKAALDQVSLQPGEESPFVVKIQATAGVSRYRVGFRTGDGVVIAHVDHRGDTPAGATGVDVGAGHPSATTNPAGSSETSTHGH